eukprot:1556543-Amphidinium_carterae.1
MKTFMTKLGAPDDGHPGKLLSAVLAHPKKSPVEQGFAFAVGSCSKKKSLSLFNAADKASVQATRASPKCLKIELLLVDVHFLLQRSKPAGTLGKWKTTRSEHITVSLATSLSNHKLPLRLDRFQISRSFKDESTGACKWFEMVSPPRPLTMYENSLVTKTHQAWGRIAATSLT